MRLYNIYRFACEKINAGLSTIITRFIFAINGVKHQQFICLGIPTIAVFEGGSCQLGKGLVMVNNQKYSMLGKSNKCKLTVFSNATLSIGNQVGMSNATIIASKSIKIGNNILIGGGVTIIDTDFHSLNTSHWHTTQDSLNMKSAPVLINDNVFIGMDSIILKGVSIGSNSVVAAGSVVVKNIPENEIWGGNPAVFIKSKGN